MNLYVVTGTTRGLGAALAAELAADAGNELVTMSRANATIEVDFADADATRAACERLSARIGERDYERAVLINNAGVVSPVGPLDTVDAGELERNLQVNLVAPMLLMRAFLGATGGVRLRRVINISSGAGRRPIFGWGGYCAAKAGLDMASRVAALECEARGLAVEIVSLAPGVIDTGMQAVVRGASAEAFADVERFRAMKAEGVLRPAEDVARDILRLEREGRLKGEVIQQINGVRVESAGPKLGQKRAFDPDPR
jgi:benzil reductase ((S)-benzoin forming)